IEDSLRRDGGARDSVRGRHRGRRSALPRASRPEYSGRDRAQPLHRVREDGGTREGVGEDRQTDSRARARTHASGSETARRYPVGHADGSEVADIGAGAGWFTIQLARRVGPNGLVYAEDVQRQMIEAIRRRVSREGLQNVRAVLGTVTDPHLPNGALDAILFV